MTHAPGLAVSAARRTLSGQALAVDVGAGSVTSALVGPDGAAAVIRRRAFGVRSDDPAERRERVLSAVDAVVTELRRAAGVTVAQLAEVQALAVSIDADPAGGTGPADGTADVELDILLTSLREDVLAQPEARLRAVRRAVATTVGEHWRGAARGRRAVLGIADGGTGIDGALILDGRLLGGSDGQAGRIGHVPVDPFGPQCGCGARGCLSAVSSSVAVVGWATDHGHLSLGSEASAADRVEVIGRAAVRGDQIALASVRRAGEAVGFAAAAAVTLLDLDVVVVSGPLVDAAGPVLLDAIDDGYRRHAGLGQAAAPRVVPGLLGPDAAVIGAAATVLHPERYG